MNRFLKYAFGAIALYLIVNGTQTKDLIINGTKGLGTDVAAFQGRKT